MGIEIVFYGGAGDHSKGELGGVQCLVNKEFLIDFGQPPDRSSEFYGFPYKSKPFLSLDVLQRLGLYPKIAGLYRHDYEHHRGNKSLGKCPLKGLAVTHPHYDHIGGIPLLRHDLPIYMHEKAAQVALAWQHTSGITNNQFIGLVNQLLLTNDKYGRAKFADGLEAIIPRDIRTFGDEEIFELGSFKITAYPVDHSTPGSCGFILDTPVGKIGWSGDIRKRGRHPERTQHFIEALKEQGIKYLFWEGSLLHFEHEGSEKEVRRKIAELIQGRALVGIAYPPRDFERIATLYEAAKDTGRMLVVSPAQALGLKLLNGMDGYPKLDWKYIGVLLQRKNKGIIDKDEFADDKLMELIERDYFHYERDFLKKDKWQASDGEGNKKGHQSKVQRVSIEELKRHQEQFIVYMPLANMPEMLEEIQPAANSIFIRSHPAPWTPEMEEMEKRQINLLRTFGMDDGPRLDYLTPYTNNGGNWRNMHQVHVAGHLNRRETREILQQFNCTIIPFHCLNPEDFVKDVAGHTKVIIPERGQPLYLD
ncbi:MAG: MBL fold metallo-hydrolase [Nanoarchaeota archaeon]